MNNLSDNLDKYRSPEFRRRVTIFQDHEFKAANYLGALIVSVQDGRKDQVEMYEHLLAYEKEEHKVGDGYLIGALCVASRELYERGGFVPLKPLDESVFVLRLLEAAEDTDLTLLSRAYAPRQND